MEGAMVEYRGTVFSAAWTGLQAREAPVQPADAFSYVAARFLESLEAIDVTSLDDLQEEDFVEFMLVDLDIDDLPAAFRPVVPEAVATLALALGEIGHVKNAGRVASRIRMHSQEFHQRLAGKAPGSRDHLDNDEKSRRKGR
jgi:hypothetical protein